MIINTKEAAELAAEYLTKQNSLRHIDKELLLKCANLSAVELARLYGFPLITYETIESDGRIPYGRLSKIPVDIFQVLQNGREVEFSLYDDYLLTEQGKVGVSYIYLPQYGEINDRLNFDSDGVETATVSYGAAADYCLKLRLFEEYAKWNELYKEIISRTKGSKFQGGQNFQI